MASDTHSYRCPLAGSLQDNSTVDTGMAIKYSRVLGVEVRQVIEREKILKIDKSKQIYTNNDKLKRYF